MPVPTFAADRSVCNCTQNYREFTVLLNLFLSSPTPTGNTTASRSYHISQTFPTTNLMHPWYEAVDTEGEGEV